MAFWNMSESVEHCFSSVTTEDNNVRIFKTPTQPLLPKIYYNLGGDKDKEGYVTNNKKFGKQVEGSCLKRKNVKRVGCPTMIKFRFCTGGKIMKELCGGFENVKGSKNDFKNFSRDLKVYISNADGMMHLTHVFWVNAIGRRDYQLFGDSLSFHSTYDTNKYSLVFCPFTGVDNHKRCVTFCAALLSKEDINSFVWLFQTFLKCMGREPSCIIIDQDSTMGIAIEKLSVVVWNREIDPCVFVDDWNNGLIYGWFTAFYFYTEGENSFFCNFTNPHVTCVEFFVRYETALDAQRHEHDELIRLNKLEPQLVTHLHLEKHAAIFYTRAIFNDFQEECEGACFSCVVESCSSLYGDGVGFSIIVDNEKRKKFDVTFDLATYESSCTCRMFESQGVLCRHILFVMKGKCIREILDPYILNRWRKDVLKNASVTNVALYDASKYDKKKQLMISKNNPENAPSSKEVKDADIQVLVGLNEVDVNILPPNQCLNKGSAKSSKRLKSVKEVATEQKSKKGRTCRACGQSGVSYDSRNYPNKYYYT
ncbi:protein FAR-RED IMPAIRED RESPONSE 1-like [Chenopodium quinoa]|uniref:protein FAR-RED IMPAIRED RESPONSE 1-like n=1 Tax=Chenopodium quinoa TaxID=63459 RepID=UPI000B77AF49|nr:protein FAR-RED IMPAIRED RESPONSE 1-like [Chenopodium quinoa]